MFSKSDPKSQFRSKGLEPYHSAEEHQHGQSNAEQDQPKKEIPVRPFQLRHVLVIHPADADEASHRDENGGNDGYALHELIHPIADTGDLHVDHVRGHPM